MVHSLTRWLGVLVALLASAAPAALAQDGGQIVRNAAAAMQRVVESTQDDIQTATTRGVAQINQLDDRGATDDELIAAAQQANRAITAQARQGARHVNLIAARAVEALRQMNADRQFFVALRDARDRAQEAIQQASRRGHNAIAVALREALND